MTNIKKQPAKDYENNLYGCLANGALKYLAFCEYGCNTTAPGQDDECLLKGTYPKRPFRQQQLKLSLHRFGFGASGG
jgi:hypothetical protein